MTVQIIYDSWNFLNWSIENDNKNIMGRAKLPPSPYEKSSNNKGLDKIGLNYCKISRTLISSVNVAKILTYTQGAHGISIYQDNVEISENNKRIDGVTSLLLYIFLILSYAKDIVTMLKGFY